MIDGYSVEEAASVLGVPEGRVWELLARGVLSGTPEGDSMRVFLKAQAGPIATAGAGSHTEPPRTNGNGGSHGANGEASAFRELLTEFRNLTERYGQALLALGEARGEVAGLRSRVDLLEARLDLRLPPPRDEVPIAWEAAPSEPLREVRDPEAPSAPQVAAPIPPTSRPRKQRTSRAAVAGFADALARAQDPTGAELPAAGEAPAAVPEPIAADAQAGVPQPVAAEAPRLSDAAAASLEALQQAFEVVAPPDDSAVPAEAEVVAEDVAEVSPDSPYSAEVAEPDWFADGDFAWLDVAEIEARSTPTGEAVEPEPATDAAVPEPFIAAQEPEPATAAPEPEPATAAAESLPRAETEAETAIEPQGEPTLENADTEPSTEPGLAAEAAPEVVKPWEPATEAGSPLAGGSSAPHIEPELERGGSTRLEAATMVVEPQPDASPEPWNPASEAQALPVQPADGEEELMWLGGRHEADLAGQSEIETASPSWRSGTVAAPERGGVATDTWRASDRSSVDEPRALALSEDELARLAHDEGWDASEVAAIRAMIGSPPAQTIQLPGADELDVAMASLETPAVNRGTDPSREWAKAARERDEPVVYEEWAYESEPSPPPAMSGPPPSAFRPPNAFPPPVTRRSMTDPGWLRSRRGPAATAYRRLRRLFPG